VRIVLALQNFVKTLTDLSVVIGVRDVSPRLCASALNFLISEYLQGRAEEI